MDKYKSLGLIWLLTAATLLLSGASPHDAEPGRVVTVVTADGFVDVYTAQTQVAAILAEAGITIDASRQRTSPGPAQHLEAGYIVVVPAAEVVVKADGREWTVYSWAATVGDLLAQQGIDLDDDLIDPPVDETLKTGQKIEIVRVHTALEQEVVTIPAQTKYRIDASVGLGETKVEIPARDGKRIISYQVIYHDGVEVDRSIVEEEVVEPVTGLVLRGAQEGIASYYGPGFHGNKTASGEVFDKNALTAAHPTLAFNTQVKVTCLNSGRSVMVRINDRGPHIADRIIDLSEAAAKAIGIYPGLGRVRVEVVN